MASKNPDYYRKSRNLKRSLVVGGNKTSVSLEEVFWRELRAIAQEPNQTLSKSRGHRGAKKLKS